MQIDLTIFRILRLFNNIIAGEKAQFKNEANEISAPDYTYRQE